MSKNRFDSAKKNINLFFENYDRKVLTFTDISNILAETRDACRIPVGIKARGFIELLLQKTKLKKHEFIFPKLKLIRYSWGDVSIFKLALSLKPNCYFTHFSALYLHGLTQQIPKSIYLNFEQPPKFYEREELKQENIDRAFSNPQRISNNVAIFKDYNIYLLNGKFTDKLGVIELNYSNNEILEVTNIERTLIDISVRPAYAGGVFEVLKAYKNASKKVSINKLAAMLKKIDYIYPYHQVVGFYLDKSGAYSKSQVDIFRKFEMKYKFYLIHKMKDVEYSEKWKLFYPKNF